MARGRFRWKLGLVSLATVGGLVSGVAPAAALAPNKPITIDFVKVCPQSICTGYLVFKDGTTEIPHSTDFWAPTSRQVAWPLIHFTATETVSSAHGTINIASAGTIDCGANPTIVDAVGSVVSGRWEGRDISGAALQELGHRLTSDGCTNAPSTALAHTFAGTLWIFANSDD